MRAITAADVARGKIRFSGPFCFGGAVYWSEGVPTDRGRSTLMCYHDGARRRLLSERFNVGTKVHEYGGGAFLPTAFGIVFSNVDDGGIYLRGWDGNVSALLILPHERFADFSVDETRGAIYCVRERHDPGCDSRRSIARVDLRSGQITDIVTGADFFASPRVSPDCAKLLWLQWNHPDMPWDGSELWSAGLFADGQLHDHRRVAGGSTEAIVSPVWNGAEISFISDRKDHWSLYQTGRGVGPVVEYGGDMATPLWILGREFISHSEHGEGYCAVVRNGAWQLLKRDPNGVVTEIAPELVLIESIVSDGEGVVVRGAAVDRSEGIWRIRRGTSHAEPLSTSAVIPGVVPPVSKLFECEGEAVQGFFYRPPDARTPPLVVVIHGGPTAIATPAFNAMTQFWVAQGYAVLDLNYRGSSGFGRRYRELLRGAWGIADVVDCKSAALQLAREGLVDRARMVIRGGSAGAFTALLSLVDSDVFCAATACYGVSDLAQLALHTHDFEARYLDRLIAPYPEGRAEYQARSPIFLSDRINAPVLFLHGADDKVCPPEQSHQMHKALRARGVQSECHMFAGEGHGFTMPATVEDALQREVAFYEAVFCQQKQS